MEWIELSKNLPKRNIRVLWYDMMFGNIEIFAMEKPEKYDGDYTHWMPLPKDPFDEEISTDICIGCCPDTECKMFLKGICCWPGPCNQRIRR